MLSLSRSKSSFHNHGSPHSVLTFHKQPEASENGHHTTFPAPLRGQLSLLPDPLSQKAHTHIKKSPGTLRKLDSHSHQ